MKKIVLSSLAALTLGSVAASASDLKLYQDANGQVYTQAGADRTEIKASTPVFSHADKLKFSGLYYLGFTQNQYDTIRSGSGLTQKSNKGKFEIRRGYTQLKAYLLDDPKSYFRVTFDLHQDSTGDTKVRAKYAYLFLNEVLPATGIEVGLAHRPWHDYEEHNSWYFRDINKVLIEDSVFGMDLSNSADFGAMLKTRTQYFDMDLGIFNGEGYHEAENGGGKSLEWRTTAHLFGTDGKDKQDKVTYFDASFFGQYNSKADSGTSTFGGKVDMNFYGLHTVYNQPEFLLAAQYVVSEDTEKGNTISKKSGKGWSINGEYRLGSNYEYRLLARYDSYSRKEGAGDTGVDGYKENTGLIAGVAWDMNKNVQWVANVTVADAEAGAKNEVNNGTAYMLTAQVEF